MQLLASHRGGNPLFGCHSFSNGIMACASAKASAAGGRRENLKPETKN
jgi:hypothetical protein